MKHLYKIFTLLVMLAGVAVQQVQAEPTPPDHVRIVQCYPNPASTFINFEFNKTNDKNLVLSIYNFVGKRVEELKITTSKINLPLDNYYRGLYFFQLKDRQGNVIESGKFQVIK